MINTPSGAIYNPDSDSTRLLRKLRYRIWEIVYKIITWKSIPKTVSSLDKAKQVREYINDFDEHLRKILESDNLRENENEELFYHEIVNRSLELLLTKLKMDYAWIWLITEEKFHPVHQAWINKALDHRVIYSQIQEAEEISTSSWKNFSIFPSEWKNWWVDAIFTFKSLNERTMWYLILDDINNKRELTNFEIEKICDLFYAKLDKLIIEYELSRVNIQNIEIRNKLEEVTKQARTDTLTSFLNRRVWDEIFAQRMADVARWDTSVTIALIDIDYFKQVNDTHWHVFWDEVIRRIAQVLNIGYTEDEKILHIRRSTDDFVRYWWEEFLCILNHTNIRQAWIFLNKIRKIIEGLVFYWKDWKTFNVTISAWITMIQKDDVDYKNQLPIDKRINIIVSRADSALYDAKSGWRNMVKAYVKK
ncbi:MAG: response regulator receiver modulated diguanylate cyclase [uncultured bacterium (gcode 4)]|uniref:Response regulator receiver modulated diguanylate cyclase n=1 Tax=uncultured bacterium (gcode 4) TaxID=1234023 RepID=K2GBV1_9BACT|nr:MAG: response regulator receiver modulated diguanylate cyclase [uncultured bacterium (gcode 4)]